MRAAPAQLSSAQAFLHALEQAVPRSLIDERPVPAPPPRGAANALPGTDRLQPLLDSQRRGRVADPVRDARIPFSAYLETLNQDAAEQRRLGRALRRLNVPEPSPRRPHRALAGDSEHLQPLVMPSLEAPAPVSAGPAAAPSSRLGCIPSLAAAAPKSAARPETTLRRAVFTPTGRIIDVFA